MITNAQRLERLKRLRALMKRHVAASGKPIRIGSVRRKFNQEIWDCGTAACTLGSVAHDPWFNRRGLVVRKPRDAYAMKVPFLLRMRVYGVQAGQVFFGLSSEEAISIFSNCSFRRDEKNKLGHVWPSAVLARIENLIKHFEK